MKLFGDFTSRMADPEKDLAQAYDIFRRTISPFVTALNNGVWPEEERYPFFKKGFSEPGMCMIECNGRVAGCYNITENDSSVVLQRVYLEPEFQRCGIGSFLISLALKQAHAAKKPLDLEVLENNTPAIHSYKKGGFQAYDFVVNGWNRKFLMRHFDTDKYAQTRVLNRQTNANGSTPAMKPDLT